MQRTGATDYYFTHDYRYSVTSVTDLSGSIIESYDYKVYGERTASGSGLTDIGYTGQRHDSETGLMYFKNRYYSTSMGSFVTRDPLGYVDGLSMYLGYFGGQGTDWNGKEIVILVDVSKGKGFVDNVDEKGVVSEQGWLSWSKEMNAMLDDIIKGANDPRSKFFFVKNIILKDKDKKDSGSGSQGVTKEEFIKAAQNLKTRVVPLFTYTQVGKDKNFYEFKSFDEDKVTTIIKDELSKAGPNDRVVYDTHTQNSFRSATGGEEGKVETERSIRYAGKIITMTEFASKISTELKGTLEIQGCNMEQRHAETVFKKLGSKAKVRYGTTSSRMALYELEYNFLTPLGSDGKRLEKVEKSEIHMDITTNDTDIGVYPFVK